MRYIITSSQLNSFRENNQLELESLLKEDELPALNELLDEALKTHPTGRDLERDNRPLKKALHLSRIGQVASSLFKEARLRLAFTQLNPSFEPHLLKELSSVSELCGGCLINLSSGVCLFISPEFELDVSDEKTLLIGIARESGRYILQKNDPHTHLLKQLGYGVGDRLSETTHPFINK